MVYSKRSGKPRGYAFIEYEHERDMHCEWLPRTLPSGPLSSLLPQPLPVVCPLPPLPARPDISDVSSPPPSVSDISFFFLFFIYVFFKKQKPKPPTTCVCVCV